MIRIRYPILQSLLLTHQLPIVATTTAAIIYILQWSHTRTISTSRRRGRLLQSSIS